MTVLVTGSNGGVVQGRFNMDDGGFVPVPGVSQRVREQGQLAEVLDPDDAMPEQIGWVVSCFLEVFDTVTVTNA